MQDKTIKSEDFFSRNIGDQFYIAHHRPIIIAINLKSPSNIGGIIRLAGNMGCKKVLFTGDPEHFRKNKMRRTATTAYDKVDWEICGEEEWIDKIPKDYQIVAIETLKGAKNIYETKLPDKIAIVVGNERFGLDEKTIKHCISAVYIPMAGHTLSMNVVQAATVSLFEWFRQRL